jgi:hypothetical protein
MKTIRVELAILAGVVGLAVQANAALYDITFTGFDGLTTAFGVVDVSGNTVTSGYLDVTYKGTTIDYDNLVPVGDTGETSGGLNLGPVDNILNVNSTTQGGFLTVNGLVFYNGASFNDRTSALMCLSDASPSDLTPNLYSGGFTDVGGFGNDTPITDGTLTVTAVPEPATLISGALMMLPLGASTLRILRKRHEA